MGLVAALLVCLAGANVSAQQSVRVGADVLLETVVHLPAGYDASRPYPLVVALHGYGGNIDSFDHLVPAFTDRGIILAVPRAPYDFVTDGHHGYDWFLQHTRDPELIKSALDRSTDYVNAVTADLQTRYSVAETYLLGFSQGGRFAYRVGLASDAFAGILAFAAGVDLAWLDAEASGEGLLPRVFIAHGMGDRRVPMVRATAARDALRKRGHEVTFESFGGGHEIPTRVGRAAIDWILQGYPDRRP